METVEFLSPARFELAEIGRYYGQISETLRQRFLDDFDLTVQKILRSPIGWAPVFRDAYRRSLHIFPYNIVYVRRSQRLVIIAVMHQRKKPGYWLARLSDTPE